MFVCIVWEGAQEGRAAVNNNEYYVGWIKGHEEEGGVAGRYGTFFCRFVV